MEQVEERARRQQGVLASPWSTGDRAGAAASKAPQGPNRDLGHCSDQEIVAFGFQFSTFSNFTTRDFRFEGLGLWAQFTWEEPRTVAGGESVGTGCSRSVPGKEVGGQLVVRGRWAPFLAL